jgi:RNA polymerase sigma factor (sigma-70 family)
VAGLSDRHVDDAVLLAATAAGDGAAFALFYRRHVAAVVGALLRETRDRELTGDLAAEVFATALLGASRYRPDYPTALPWLCGIARNKVSESRRRGRAESRARMRLGIPREQLEDLDLQRVEELASQGEVAELLGQLPPAQRAALEARVIDERGYPEIAAELRTSQAAVRQNVKRALAWLRLRMSEENQ